MQLLFSQPLLSTSSAHLISLGLCAIYVGSLYLSKNARLQFSNGSAKGKLNEQDERGRDHPDVIRARLVAVSIATIVCLVIVFSGLWLHAGGTLQVRVLKSLNEQKYEITWLTSRLVEFACSKRCYRSPTWVPTRFPGAHTRECHPSSRYSCSFLGAFVCVVPWPAATGSKILDMANAHCGSIFYHYGYTDILGCTNH